jgi:type VI secretion system protein ImpB
MGGSYQSRLGRVRKPRVHITYDVETGGAMEKRELPFVVGVLGDFSGHPTEKLPPLRDRKFVEIDRDNINDVLRKMTPGLNLKVENTLAGDGSELGVQLKFQSMEDFEPAKVVEQVEPLRKLMETRNHLRDLLAKVDVNTDLEATLEDVLRSTEQTAKFAKELGIDPKS